MQHIIGVILAAGMSSRMGSENKLLLDYKERTIIETVLNNLVSSQVHHVIVVTGYEKERVSEAIAEQIGDRVTVVYNERFVDGRAESIKCAIHAVGDKADAVLFMVGDKPTVTTSLINRTLTLYKQKDYDLFYVMTPSGRGHPIIYSKHLFDELLVLEGDQVGNTLIEKYKKTSGNIYDNRLQLDIDKVDDYTQLIKHMG